MFPSRLLRLAAFFALAAIGRAGWAARVDQLRLSHHARNFRDIPGDPLHDPNRHARAQVLHWRADGTPDFGTHLPDGPLPR